jgi:hypothetical protein
MNKWLFSLVIILCGQSFVFSDLPKEEPEKTNSSPAFLSEKEENVVETLIATTEKRLQKQKELRELVSAFKKEKDIFTIEQTKKNAGQMVQTARKIMGIISEEKLQYLFSSDYLDELLFFSSIAGRNAPARP